MALPLPAPYYGTPAGLRAADRRFARNRGDIVIVRRFLIFVSAAFLLSLLAVAALSFAGPLDVHWQQLTSGTGGQEVPQASPVYAAAGSGDDRAKLPGGTPAPSLDEDADPVDPAEARSWTESGATRDYWNRKLRYRWANEPADWIDASGTPQGNRPVATGKESGGTLDMTIPTGVTDLFVRGVEGWGWFDSRESDRPPTLDGVPVVADTTLNSSTYKNAGSSKRLGVKSDGERAFLIRLPSDRGGTLALSVDKKGSGRLSVEAFVPSPQVERPTIPDLARGRLIETFAPKAARAPHRTTSLPGGAVRIDVANDDLVAGERTIIRRREVLPPLGAATLVDYVRVGGTTPRTGGKLFGLTNTRGSLPVGEQEIVIGGEEYDKAGWGGRKANGLAWSARGLFLPDFAGGTYAYSWGRTRQKKRHGAHIPMIDPLPKGELVARVQYVAMNTPGQADGVLAQWLVTPDQVLPSLWRDNMEWRKVDHPAALINEVDLGWYIGGNVGGGRPRARQCGWRITATKSGAAPPISTPSRRRWRGYARAAMAGHSR